MRATRTICVAALVLSCTPGNEASRKPKAGFHDVVELDGAKGKTFGVLVDGEPSSGPAWKEKPFQSSKPKFELGNLKAPANKEQVITFNRTAAVEIEDAKWTPGPNKITVPQRKRIKVGLTFWLTQKPFKPARKRALEAVVASVAIFDDENTGIEIDGTTKGQVHADTAGAAAAFATFKCSDKSTLLAALPPTTGRINVYYTDIVEGHSGFSSQYGNACAKGSPFIAMGSLSSDHLLAHEIGHVCGLADQDGSTGFHVGHVMHKASDDREYFTEGESVYMNYGPFSLICGSWSSITGQPAASILKLPSVKAAIWPNPKPAPLSPAPPLLAGVFRWSIRDCGLAKPEIALAKLGPPADVANEFLARLQRPSYLSQDERDRIRDAARRRFGRRQKLLAGRRLRLSGPDRALLAAVTQQEYEQDALRDAELGARSTAMLTLSALPVDVADVRALLTQVAAQGPQELRSSAQAALDMFGP